MVIEDDGDIRDSLMEFLEENGFAVIGACDGHDALSKLEQSELPPCLIILDLMMPVMDGRGFRERQLSERRFADIPVVVISANRDVTAGSQGLDPIASFAKPINLSSLLTVVRRHCDPTDLPPRSDA